MSAWKGLVAEGVPESGFAFFSDASTPAELIGLALILEEGSRKFYSEVAEFIPDKESGDLFGNLSRAEEHHKKTLVGLYQDFFGSPPEEDFPDSRLSADDSGDVMEGGMKIKDALKWARGKNAAEILELSVALETNAYDLYIRMGRKMTDDKSATVFQKLARDEKKHLEKLTDVLEKKV